MSVLIDLGLAALVLLSLVAGMRSGFVDSVFSLAAWVGGGLLAFHAPSLVLAHLPERFQSFPGATILTAVFLFLAGFMVIRLIGIWVGGSSKEGGKGIDRLLGFLFGAARGIFLAAAVASFLVAYLPANSGLLRNSRAVPILAPAGRVIAGLAPAPLRHRMDEGWERVARRAPVAPGGAVQA